MKLLALTALALLGACTPTLRRFPLAEPVWRDEGDTRPTHAHVASYESSDLWDFIDQTIYRPSERTLLAERVHESLDVNAVDEVPDSSWFENRALRGALDPAAVARGHCTDTVLDPATPWTVIGAKPDGISPGFTVRGPGGTHYLLKSDGDRQSERASAADTIGSRIYWALGYFAPCDNVVVFDRSILQVDPGAANAVGPGGRRVTPAVLDHVLSLTTRLPDGRFRMLASRFVEGAPLGPFAYQGTRADDPDDVIAHDDRREIRASRLLAAWLNHYDLREQNTFTTWMTPTGHDGPGYVRHWFIDFGDVFGWAAVNDDIARRAGNSYTMDVGLMAADFATLGLITRPWDRARVDPEAWIFGYFSSDGFDPEAWHATEPNPAFARMTERDGAWMARLIARFGPAQIHAAVEAGALSRPEWNTYLERALLARRARVLERYLTRLSPLADAHVEAGERLCATDLAARAHVPLGPRAYGAVRYAGPRFAERGRLAVATDGTRVCVALGPHLAADGGVRDDDPARYLVVDVVGAARGRAPLRVHLYDLGAARGYRLVGLERPDDDAPPRG